MRIMKKCIWFALVILMSCLLILEGKAIVDMILFHSDLAASDNDHLGWSIQKLIVFYLGCWFFHSGSSLPEKQSGCSSTRAGCPFRLLSPERSRFLLRLF